MTYSIEMFLAVMVGLTIGHGLFNLGETSSGETPCCPAEITPPARDPTWATPKAVKEITSSSSETHRCIIQVDGMTCQNCVSAVRRAISEIPEVQHVVQIDLKSGVVVLELGCAQGQFSRATVQQTCLAIEQIGFIARDKSYRVGEGF
eukprot:CAMPEP_0115048866 /NCGR_PEP_ID=MMETSP0227-20121206/845_1 /TAXON_ID=89957 /ORGANISM="Polarella glacialis, Strain CCMP 1383" /LENGTH=147 /DNA_ID=CAMNT_0002432415 /DNA_START=249 /DNA_END=692 /DNA_ORIENTATION=+